MQERVPNQYKPSFIQNLLSGIMTVPTRRILSNKKLQKQRKINLSLTQDKKATSSKKLKLSNSFRQKQTPFTISTNQPLSASQQKTFKRTQQQNNRGINFHPCKINFYNENTIKPKIKSKLVLNLSSISRKKQKYSHQTPLMKETQKMSSQSSYQRFDKREPVYFNLSPNTCRLQQTKNTKQNPQFNKQSFEQIYAAIMQKFVLENINSSQKTQQTNLQQNQFINQNKIREQFSPKQVKFVEKQVHYETFHKNTNNNTNKIQQIRRSPQILPEYRDSQFFIDQDFQRLSLKKDIEKNNESKDIQNLNTQKIDRNKLNMQNFINNLFDNAQTIQSKYDQSSRRSESICYSNVIYRMNGNQFNKNIPNQPRDWDELRRKSLNTNLIHKFQQNQSINCTQHPRMNFTKKNLISQENSITLRSNQQSDSIRHIEDIFMNATSKQITQSYITSQNSNELRITNKNKQPYFTQFNKINYIGVGRFASVYLCVSTQINFIFAIKQVLKFTVLYNSIEDQLKKQIAIQYQCNHPNLISLYYAWSDSKKYYLAMEYGQQTLLIIIQKYSNLSQIQCLCYIKQIAQGLQYLHKNGIVHRDIKPENIVLVNGTCKIADFGWVTKINDKSLNQLCGTPCYISPQIQKSQPYTYKTDCWSLGILAYELINGKLDENMFDGRALNRDILQFKRSVSVGYRQLVYNLLAVEQKNRFSASQLLNLNIFKNL